MGSQYEDARFGDVTGQTLSLEATAGRVFPEETRGGLQVETLMMSSIHRNRAKNFTFLGRSGGGRFNRTFLTFAHECEFDDSASRRQQYAGTNRGGTRLLRFIPYGGEAGRTRSENSRSKSHQKWAKNGKNGCGRPAM